MFILDSYWDFSSIMTLPNLINAVARQIVVLYFLRLAIVLNDECLSMHIVQQIQHGKVLLHRISAFVLVRIKNLSRPAPHWTSHMIGHKNNKIRAQTMHLSLKTMSNIVLECLWNYRFTRGTGLLLNLAGT